MLGVAGALYLCNMLWVRLKVKEPRNVILENNLYSGPTFSVSLFTKICVGVIGSSPFHPLSDSILSNRSREGRESNGRIRYIRRIHSLGGCVPDHLRAVPAADSVRCNNMLYDNLLRLDADCWAPREAAVGNSQLSWVIPHPAPP